MVYKLIVASRNDTDLKGQELLAEIKRTFKKISITNIRTSKIYRLEGISQNNVKKLAQNALYESIDQIISYKNPIYKANKSIEVAYKPGVMNPEVASIRKAASDLGIKLQAADSSYEYSFFGKINEKLLEEIINKLLVNETVEHIVRTSPKTLIISGKPQKTKIIPIRKLGKVQLMNLSKDTLFLNLEEMMVIKNYFTNIKRDPTDCELEILALTWSEHCGHKTFKAKLTIDGIEKEPFFTRIKKTAKFNKKIIVSAFVDNSGVISFDQKWAVCGKVETHNSPSAIEPYGGAMTGSGGVFRDILGTGKGAKVLISTDIFCFAPPDMPKKILPPGCLPPDYILRKVVAGVRDYGNRVGIPTNNGSIHFHNDFRAKPTVAVGSYGLIEKKNAKKTIPKPTDLIFTIGGKTGRDGVHGATFASGEMTDQTVNTSGSRVQIGNAIEEKRVIDFVLAISKKNLISSITDCGAGGYCSAIGELAKDSGATVNLEKVPLKYPNLAPWEIFLSESQERMIITVSPRNIKRLEKIAKIYNVEATAIGRVTNNKTLVVKYKNETVAKLSMLFIHEGLPQRHMIGKSTKRIIKINPPKGLHNVKPMLIKILSDPSVASKEPILRMYDHNVQGTNALHPFSGVNYDGPNDGAIVKTDLSQESGLATAHGLNPIMNKIDPYWGSIWSITEAVSNYVAFGGDLKKAALIDNFIWPFPDEESIADLDKSVDACFDMAKILNMPFVSGKDSLSSTYRYPDGKILKIPPVLLISVFGKIDDVNKTASSDFKNSDSIIILVGNQDIKNLGGSIYWQITKSTGNVPKVDVKNLHKVLEFITKGIKSRDILSCHDISEGGLATAICEMAFGGNVGVQIDLPKNIRPDIFLFSETPGSFVVEVKNKKTVKKIFKNIPHQILGKTIKQKKIILNQESINLEELKNTWQKPMKEIFHS